VREGKGGPTPHAARGKISRGASCSGFDVGKTGQYYEGEASSYFKKFQNILPSHEKGSLETGSFIHKSISQYGQLTLSEKEIDVRKEARESTAILNTESTRYNPAILLIEGEEKGRRKKNALDVESLRDFERTTVILEEGMREKGRRR